MKSWSFCWCFFSLLWSGISKLSVSFPGFTSDFEIVCINKIWKIAFVSRCYTIYLGLKTKVTRNRNRMIHWFDTEHNKAEKANVSKSKKVYETTMKWLKPPPWFMGFVIPNWKRNILQNTMATPKCNGLTWLLENVSKYRNISMVQWAAWRQIFGMSGWARGRLLGTVRLCAILTRSESASNAYVNQDWIGLRLGTLIGQ